MLDIQYHHLTSDKHIFNQAMDTNYMCTCILACSFSIVEIIHNKIMDVTLIAVGTKKIPPTVTVCCDQSRKYDN